MNEADVQQRARAFMAGIDISNVREDLSPYLAAVNAKVVKEPLGKGESGCTITRPDGKHVIAVNSLEPEQRQRFTVCHEVAHIVLKLESSHEEVPSWSFAKRHSNEVACDLFAPELLMPYQQWLAAVPNEEPSIALIERMAAEFRVSFPAAASRFASLADIACAFVTMDRGTVRYAARSTLLRRVRAWVQPRSPIPAGSVSARLRASQANATDTAQVAQDVWFENWVKGLDLWELARHYRSSDTTIALLWLDDDGLPEVDTARLRSRAVSNGDLAELTGDLPWPGKRRKR